jgi:hypothetical protein
MTEAPFFAAWEVLEAAELLPELGRALSFPRSSK